MASTSVDDDDDKTVQFHDMGIDDRILEAISKLGWSQPTPIQEKAIPLALQGKDILARAQTGSGKTAAYAIAVIQKLLHLKQTAAEQATRAIILTPSKELCNQAYRNILELTVGCSRDIRCSDISPKVPLSSQRSILIEKPDILVATPSRLLAHVRAGNVDVRQTLEMLVVDEADLVFSFGYEGDIKELLDNFPKIYQAFMMSATLDEDVKALKKMVLHNAAVLRLEESRLPEASKLNQYHIKCEQNDKYALVAALLKLNLIKGKTIFFVNSVNRCYQLKLFLEQFGIRACILNSELPVNSRCHIVQQFNDGLYDFIIASDETTTTEVHSQPSKINKKQKKRLKKQDQEYGVSRGIDFYNVSNVINFDFPKTVDSYIHRVGRTARADNQGTALSFVTIADNEKLKNVETTLNGDNETGAAVSMPTPRRHGTALHTTPLHMLNNTLDLTQLHITLVILMLCLNSTVEAYEHVCSKSDRSRAGICGNALNRMINLVCSMYGKKRMVKRSVGDFLGASTDDDIIIPDKDSPMLSRRTALSYLTKTKRGSAFQGLVCECCYHQCSLPELTGYC